MNDDAAAKYNLFFPHRFQSQLSQATFICAHSFFFVSTFFHALIAFYSFFSETYTTVSL